MMKKGMKKKQSWASCCNWGGGKHHGHMGSGYFLGFLGALIYFLQTSTGFGNSILAILKAIVWPALLVYHLLGL